MSIDHTKRYSSASAGFTLIELMISLVLGLLISAAVMQVYLINIRTLTVQQSASEVQDNTIFALQAVDEHVRIANLGNPINNINDITSRGGIVLTASNVENIDEIETGYMTVSAKQAGTTGSDGWTGISNITDVPSDQLTIQYRNITPASLYDCEGEEIVSGADEWVIERYFLRLATGASTTSSIKDLVLACDAGRIDSANVVSGFGEKGEVVAPSVDQFKVLLGTLTDVTQLSYLPAKTYLELTDKPPITTVKLGIILSSSTPLMTNTYKTDFNILGQAQSLKTDTERQKRYRRDYESTIVLRSARVMSVTGLKSKITS